MKSAKIINQISATSAVNVVRTLVSATDMSQRAFADYFGIPLRTLENWCSGSRTCPAYLVDLMMYKLEHEGILPQKQKVPER